MNHQFDQPFYLFENSEKLWWTLPELKALSSRPLPADFDKLFTTCDLSRNVMTCRFSFERMKKGVFDDPVAALLECLPKKK